MLTFCMVENLWWACIQWWMLYVTKDCQNQVKYDGRNFYLCVFAKFRLIQALCDLIFAILHCAFCSLAPAPVITKVITVKNNGALQSCLQSK